MTKISAKAAGNAINVVGIDVVIYYKKSQNQLVAIEHLKENDVEASAFKCNPSDYVELPYDCEINVGKLREFFLLEHHLGDSKNNCEERKSFMEVCHESGLIYDYYDERDQAYAELLTAWCKLNGVPVDAIERFAA